MSDTKIDLSREDFFAQAEANWPKTDYRVIYLEVRPSLAAYLDLAQWILKRHGKERWQEDSQYSWRYCFLENQLCYFLQNYMHLNFAEYLEYLANRIGEDVINLWADGELHGKLISFFRNYSLQTSIH